MNILSIMKEKGISKYKLSKDSGIPYMTVNDICNDRTSLKNCCAQTVYKLSKALDVTMEQLLEPVMLERPAFDLFKSEICHRLKRQGDIGFLTDTLGSNEIMKFYEREWYPESLYLLAMVDYISRINDVPLCDDYAVLRKMKLGKVVFPKSVLAVSRASDSDDIKTRAIEESIPEFIRFNIVESDVRNVI